MSESGSSSSNSAVGLDGRIVAQILHHIAASIYHLRIYGELSPNLLQSIDIVVNSVTFLTQTAPLDFEFQEGRQEGFSTQSAKVWINGTVFEPQAEESAWTHSVVRLAKKSGWSKLTLCAGLTNEEWMAFLTAASGGTEIGAFPHVQVEWGPA